MKITTAAVDDIDAIVSLYRKYQFALQKRPWLEWKLFDNPVGPPTMYKILLDGKIAGAVSVIPQNFWLNDRPYYALQAVDGLMGKEIRGKGAFNTLMVHVLETPPPSTDRPYFFMGFVTLSASAKALTNAGWTRIATSSLHSFLINPSPIRKVRFGKTVLPLLKPLWAAFRSLVFRAADPMIDVSQVNHFDVGFNHFRPLDKLAGDRSASFLNWRIAANPRSPHQFFSFSVGGRPVGYVVTQTVDRTMEIIEMRFDEKPAQRLARFLQYVHMNQLADQVDIKMLEPFDAKRLLPGPGFVRRRFNGQMFANGIDKAGISGEQRRWAATFLDSDW